MSEQPLHGFRYYETDKGLIVKRTGRSSARYTISDVEPEPTFHPEWFLIPGVLKFEDYKAHDGYDYVNERYERAEDGICTLPLCLHRDEIEKDDDGDWIGKYRGLQGQYTRKTDQVDRGFKPQECTIQFLGSFDLKNLTDPTKFSYELHGQGFGEREKRQLLTVKDLWNKWAYQQYITVGDITKAMVPELAWHLHPVKLTSDVTYRIVRAYIKDHIDPKVAEISSDYDFCFQVQKRIAVKPFDYSYEVPRGARSRRRPQFVNKTVTFRSEKVFEMTHAAHPYQGYTVIAPFEGRNLEDLSKNIDAYLAELISVINTPTVECEHCAGKGVLEFTKAHPNNRKE